MWFQPNPYPHNSFKIRNKIFVTGIHVDTARFRSLSLLGYKKQNLHDGDIRLFCALPFPIMMSN